MKKLARLYRVTWVRLVITDSGWYGLVRTLLWFVPFVVGTYVAANPLLGLACMGMASGFYVIGKLVRARQVYRVDVEQMIIDTGEHPDIAKFYARRRLLDRARER